MRKIYIILILTVVFSCTSEFEEFKVNPDQLTGEDVSAKYFFTNTQVKIWAPAFWDFFWGSYVYGERYGGYTGIGFKGNWEPDEVCYNADLSWSSSAAWSYLDNYYSTLDLYIKAVDTGGEFENDQMYAVGLIMKATYFSIFTDVFGEIPFSEVGKEGVLLPKFDTQKVIYKGNIALLDEAMEIIGNNERTGAGVDDLGENDILFGGDLQKWKRYANTLKLRIALRGHGSEGDDFTDAAITEALSNPLITESVGIVKDMEVDARVSATYADPIDWYGNSARQKVSHHLINFLQDNNDPRLTVYASPLEGGDIVFEGYEGEDNTYIIDFLISNLDDASVNYTRIDDGTTVTISIAPGTYYAGIPLRITSAVRPFADARLFSDRGEKVEGKHTIGEEYPEMIIPMAESYFLQAEAALLGFGGDAQALMDAGIQASFEQWEVSDNGYIGSPLVTFTGDKETDLEILANQLWVALYTVKYQGWATARDFGYPEFVTADITDDRVLGFGTTNGKYPQRLRYGNNAYSINGDNLNEAISRQGPDRQATQLWFASGAK